MSESQVQGDAWIVERTIDGPVDDPTQQIKVQASPETSNSSTLDRCTI